MERRVGDLYDPNVIKHSDIRAAEATIEQRKKQEESFDSAVKKIQEAFYRGFREQEYIAANFDKIIQQQETRNKSKSHLYLTTNESSESFISKLLRREGAEEILNMTPAQQSCLVPKIRLYKVFLLEGGKKKEVEYTFKNFIDTKDIEKIFKDKKARGGGAGVESFKWSYEGTDLATSDRNILASLTILFSSLDEFFEERTIDGEYKIGFSDFTWFKQRSSMGWLGNYGISAKNNPPFIVKAHVGWSFDQNNPLLSKKLKDALNSHNIVLQLFPVNYQTEIAQAGYVRMTFDFISSLEGLMNSADADIFYSIKEADKKFQNSLLKFEAYELDDEAEKKGVDIRTIERDLEKKRQEEIKELRQQEIYAAYKILLEMLKCNDQIYSLEAEPLDVLYHLEVDLTPEEKQAYLEKIPKNQNSDANDHDEQAKKILQGSSQSPELSYINGRFDIKYFFFGDLVDAAMRIVEGNNPKILQDLKILFGNITIKGDGGELKSISIADLPISLNNYLTWFKANVIKTGVPSVFLKNFIFGLLQSLIRPSLHHPKGLLGRYPQSKRVLFSSTVLTFPKKRDKKVISESNQQISPEQESWFIVFAIDYEGAHFKKIDVEKDQKNGVYHLYEGRNRGITEEIKYAQRSDEALRSVRMAKIKKGIESSDGLMLLDVFDANVALMGNNIFTNGSKIFLHPSPMLANETNARRFGLLGYYTVIKTECEITPSSFKTNLTCMTEMVIGFNVGEEEGAVTPRSLDDGNVSSTQSYSSVDGVEK